MHRYKTSCPRAVFSIAAVAMMATTFGLTVVVPAEMDSVNHEVRTSAKPATVTLATSAAPVVAVPCVDVDANRESKVKSVQLRKQQG